MDPNFSFDLTSVNIDSLSPFENEYLRSTFATSEPSSDPFRGTRQQNYSSEPNQSHHPLEFVDNERQNFVRNLWQLLDSALLNVPSAIDIGHPSTKQNLVVRTAKQAIEGWLASKRCLENSMRGSDHFAAPTDASTSTSSNWFPTPVSSNLSQDVSISAPGSGSRGSAFLPTRLPGGFPSQHESTVRVSCTVCPRRVSKDAYDWKRHESSHYGPWICMPDKSHIIGEHCAICGLKDVSDRHRNTHYKLEECVGKDIVDRGFRGRDKLIDHLRIHLGPAVGTEVPRGQIEIRRRLLKSWEGPDNMNKSALWCGFCEDYLKDWSARQEHVLQHLRRGEPMQAWLREPAGSYADAQADMALSSATIASSLRPHGKGLRQNAHC